MAHRETEPRLAEDGADRGTGPGRLEPEQAGVRGGDPDRTATVGGVGGGHHPRCDRRRRSTGAAAHRHIGVPRIAGDAPEDGLGGPVESELGGVGLPEDHQPGPFEPADEGGGVVGHVVAHRPGSVRERHALPGRTQVLEQKGHAGERTVRDSGLHETEGPVVGGRDHRVEAGVVPLDPLDRRVHHLPRRHLTRRDQPGESDRIVILVLVEPHRPNATGHAGRLGGAASGGSLSSRSCRSSSNWAGAWAPHSRRRGSLASWERSSSRSGRNSPSSSATAPSPLPAGWEGTRGSWPRRSPGRCRRIPTCRPCRWPDRDS